MIIEIYLINTVKILKKNDHPNGEAKNVLTNSLNSEGIQVWTLIRICWLIVCSDLSVEIPLIITININFCCTLLKKHAFFAAAQFTFNRDRAMELSTFMGHEEGIPEEDEDEEETEEEDTPRDQHRGSLDYTRPQLSDIQEGKGTPRDQHQGSLDYTRPQLSDIQEGKRAQPGISTGAH